MVDEPRPAVPSGGSLTRLSRRFVVYGSFALVCAAALSIGSASWAFIRLATSTSGATGLFWGGVPISYIVHASGSDDIADQSEETAIQLGFAAWDGVEGSSVSFAQDTRSSSVNGAKTASNDGRNLILFDENNSTGRFTGASFVVAITPVFFDSSGRIVDADIVFNGRDHAFTTNPKGAGESGKFDIQGIVTHEIGHFLGFDHSAVHGATMIPFANPNETRLRSLEGDDRAAAQSVYAGGAPVGSVTGQVVFASGSTGVNGAHVVVTNASTGAPASSALTRSNGTFTVTGVPAGTYRVYAEPLDGPTEDGNLQRSGVDIGFQTTFVGSVDAPQTVAVSAGGSTSIGTIAVGTGTGLNIRGASISGESPGVVRRGRSTSVYLTGTSLFGCAVEIPGSGVTHDAFVGQGGRVSVTVASNAPPGLRDIVLRRGSGASREAVVLPGGLEVTDEAPIASGVVPAEGPLGGGGQVDVVGSSFEAGARVRFGDQLVPTFETVYQSAGTLQVVVPAGTQPGAVSVTVINPDGQESHLSGAYTFRGDPQPAFLSPTSGPSAGGVSVTITGTQFAAGARVWFGNGQASAVSVAADGASLTCNTPAGRIGERVDVTVRNPDGTSGTLYGAYVYVAPTVTGVSPNRGSTSGGARVVVTGSAFAPGAQVWFGDALGSSLQLLSQTQLKVTAPAHPVASVSITVTNRDGATGVSSSRLFTYVNAIQPIIASVSPSSGSVEGGFGVVITGQGFESGALVRIGGLSALNVQVTATRIDLLAPAGQTGGRDVQVQNPTGLSAIAVGALTYVALPASEGGGGGGGMGCAFEPGRRGGATPLLGLLVALFGFVVARRRRRRPAGVRVLARGPDRSRPGRR